MALSLTYLAWSRTLAAVQRTFIRDGRSSRQVRTRVRDVDIHVTEETEYPFRGSVRIKLNPTTAISFPLRLRIPAWAEGTSITVNGVAVNTASNGEFAKIERVWKPGDVVEVQFPMIPRTSKGYNDSISVEQGPLVFSFPIGESWVKLRDRGMTADWQVFPSTQWNYGLYLPAQDAEKLQLEEAAVGKSPFSVSETPVKLHVSARKLPTWQAVDGVADPVPQNPVSSSEPVEKITLVPYAAAKLRITAFPELKS
jgi:uncharacterized protein